MRGEESEQRKVQALVLCRRRHGRADRRSVRGGRRTRPARRAGLHVPGGRRSGRRERRFARSRGCRAAPIAASIPARRSELAELLRAAAAYAAGGMKALADLSAQRNAGAQKLLRADEIAMPTLIFGIVVLALVLWALNGYRQGRSAEARASCCGTAGGDRGARGGGLSRLARPVRGWRCRSALSGLGCSAGCRSASAGFGQRTQKTPGQVSRVRSAFVEMELDHDTGAMRGRILAGPSRGRDARRARRADADRRCCRRSTRRAARYWRRILTAGSPAGVNTRRVMRQRGRGDVAQRQNDGRGGLSDPWPAAGGERRRHRPRAPRADEETPSRPGGLDVSRGPDQ